MIKSRLGFHVDVTTYPAQLDKMIYAAPRIVKVIQSLSVLQHLHAALGDKCTYIARHWAVGDSFQNFGVGLSAKAKAKLWYDTMLPYIRQVPWAVWEAFNEPDTSPNSLVAYNAFETERQYIMADNGYRCAVGSFATGQPELGYWPYLYPMLEAAHRFRNILSLHEYGALWLDAYYSNNSIERMQTGQHRLMPLEYAYGWLAFRYRQVWDTHIASHGWTGIQIALTEYGLMSAAPAEINAIAGQPVGAWRTCGVPWSNLNGRSDKEQFYVEQLQWADRQMQKDPYVAGATIFTWGQSNWPDDEIEGTVANSLVNYIHDTQDNSPAEDTMARAKGVDTSYYDGDFSWENAKNQDGIQFAIVRFGHGLVKDTTFDTSFARAKAAGLPVGVYYFPNAELDIDQQAAFLATAPWAECDLPVAIDVERNPALDIQINEAKLKRLMEEVSRLTGRLPAVYTSKVAWDAYIGTGKTWASKYPLWVADYRPNPYPELPDPWSNWLIWQWTVAPLVSTTRSTDQDVFNGTLTDLGCRFPVPLSAELALRWPVNSTRITQAFGNDPAHYGPLLGAIGMGHEGIDFAANLDDPIYACADGVIAERYYDDSYGYMVVIDHQNGLKTLYGHMNRISPLTVGTRVLAGTRIGDAGTTGASTGVHLHLSLYHDNADKYSVYPKKSRGYLINPTPYLQLPTQAPVQMRMIYTQAINIRAEATINSADIGDVEVGEIVQAEPPAVNEYLKITAHGITGYALAKHFELVPEQLITLRSTANPYVNIRSGPATSYPDIGDLYYNQEIQGYPTTENGFYKVLYNNGIAYISAQWLVVV